MPKYVLRQMTHNTVIRCVHVSVKFHTCVSTNSVNFLSAICDIGFELVKTLKRWKNQFLFYLARAKDVLGRIAVMQIAKNESYTVLHCDIICEESICKISN